MTSTDCNTRRMTKAIMSGLSSRARLIHRDPVPVEEVIGELRQVHVVLDAPGERLLVQRDMAKILLVNLERLIDFRLALRRIKLAGDLGDQLVEARVGVFAQVEL